jgi:hypothetical protein
MALKAQNEYSVIPQNNLSSGIPHMYFVWSDTSHFGGSISKSGDQQLNNPTQGELQFATHNETTTLDPLPYLEQHPAWINFLPAAIT